MYRSNNNRSPWTTREIAALNFLMGIPLQKEKDIVCAGLGLDQQQQQHVSVAEEDSQHDHKISVSSSPKTVTNQPQRWWEKLISKDKGFEAERSAREILELETGILERPTDATRQQEINQSNSSSSNHVIVTKAEDYSTLNKKQGSTNDNGVGSLASIATPRENPGRRLEGVDATFLSIPRVDGQTELLKTRHRMIFSEAAVKEWEMRVAHGLQTHDNSLNINAMNDDIRTQTENQNNSKDNLQNQKIGLLDGRVFFCSNSSYPLSVFSVIKYQPQKEKAARRRKKIEERGGGGMQFVIPGRDWRGISYRAFFRRSSQNTEPILQRKGKENIKKSSSSNLDYQIEPQEKIINSPYLHDGICKEDCDNANSDSDYSDDLSVSSSEEATTSYVPGFLDDPEMVQGRHRNIMIGDQVTGCVVSSTIQFVRPADLKAELNKQFKERFDGWEPPKSHKIFIGAKVINGVFTPLDPTDEINMPPSLTLSKIRNVKQQAFIACVKADLEVSTVSLACVYFERLCLDCTVDKSNRKLSFASCLLLAAKTNEDNVSIVHNSKSKETSEKKGTVSFALRSSLRPNKKHSTIFASLLEFFTQQWSLSLKNLFEAEWGVFAALGFSLHATPSQVSFHFKRFMKSLECSPLNYLEQEMFNQWQNSLVEESHREDRKKKRRELKEKLKDQRLMKLQRKLQLREKAISKTTRHSPSISELAENMEENDRTNLSPISFQGGEALTNFAQHHENRSRSGKQLFNRIGFMKNLGGINDKSAIKVDTGMSPSQIRSSESKSSLSRSVSSPNITSLKNEKMNCGSINTYDLYQISEKELREENNVKKNYAKNLDNVV